MATVWLVGPDEEDKGGWLNEALGAVSTLTRSTTFADQLRSIREEIPWLTASPAVSQKAPVLLGMPNQPLAPQLADRWRGRRFDKLLLFTGSTDVDGAFLAWANRAFGVQHATVCCSPAYASFDPAKLAKLPLDIRIIAADPEKYLHAKFYWFSGGDGNAAVVGSANCSAAAWLAGAGWGNVELIVPYDDAQAANFDTVLSIFNAPKHQPQKILTAKPVADAQNLSSAARHRLVSVRLRPVRTIEAVLDPPLAPDAEIDLVITGASGIVTVRLAAQSRGLTGRLPAEFDLGLMTPFAHAEGLSGGARFTTERRWIDNDALLERVAQARNIDPNLQDLSRRSLFASNHQRILEAVQAVSAQLLRPPDENETIEPTWTTRSVSNTGNKSNIIQAPVAIDPSAMIRDLNDLKRQSQTRLGARPSVYGGSLTGVIAMLFAHDEPDDIDLTGEAWSAAEPEKDPDDPTPLAGAPASPPATGSPPEAVVSLETRTIFHAEIDAFLRELNKPSFAETCEALRMVQALAFPLLLCVRGSETGWLPQAELASVAARTAEIMFDRFYERGKPRGLFAAVRERYLQQSRIDEFHRAVGDGTLWAALLAALSIDPTASAQIVVRQAAALASVFHCAELLATIDDPTRLSALVRALLIQDAESHITEKAERITRAHDALVALLSDRWGVLYQEQGSGRRLQPGGSLLWSRHWGWYATPSFPAQGYQSGYVNLQTAAEGHQEVQEAVTRVFDACRL